MRQKTSAFYVPIVLCAIGFTLVFQGCEKAQEVPPRESPASYMNDKDFRGKLQEMRAARNELSSARVAVVEKMQAKIEAAKARLGTSDEAKLKVELEKDPEWKSLYAQCEDLNKAIKDQRSKTMGVVRDRIVPKKEVSK